MLLICSAEDRVIGFLHDMAHRTVKNAASSFRCRGRISPTISV
ncbi:hypothetical protein [Bradyrhizobium elkanii]